MSGAAVVAVAVLVGAAARLLLGPRARDGGSLGELRALGDPRGGRRVGLRSGRRSGRRLVPAVAVAQVAALLRSGAPPADAWHEVIGARVQVGGDLVPDALAAAFTDVRQVAGVVAATRLAHAVGAPLAGVLDDVGAALAAADDARAAQDGALSGPRTTARVLAWMPLAGIGLGYALGADPVGVLLGGGAGTVAGVLAVVLVVVGRVWTARLVEAARRAGAAA